MIYSKFNLKLCQNDFLLPIPGATSFFDRDKALTIEQITYQCCSGRQSVGTQTGVWPVKAGEETPDPLWQVGGFLNLRIRQQPARRFFSIPATQLNINPNLVQNEGY